MPAAWGEVAPGGGSVAQSGHWFGARPGAHRGWRGRLRAGDRAPLQRSAVLERLQTLDLLLPWSLVENVFADGTERLPLQAGLNAGFQTPGACRLLARADGRPHAIHRAAESQPVVRKGMSAFYPPPDAVSIPGPGRALRQGR